MSSLVTNIKFLCKSKGTSIAKVERELGFGRGTIYNWDKSSPSINNVRKVAGYFRVSISYIIHGFNKADSAESGMNELTTKIEQWATDRNLNTADPNKQILKLGEEFGELCAGMARGDTAKVFDSIGDMFVVMTILSMQLGVSIQDCVESAYDEIKDRKGRMIDGVFVKEADLRD